MHANHRATAGVIALFTGGLLTGAWTATAAADNTTDPYAPVDTLVRVLGLVQSRYVDDLPTDQLVSSAIDGMVDHLDPHSQWMDANTWRAMQNETWGTYTGIGVEVKLTEHGAQVTRVMPGSPASRDGVSVGDTILSIDGRALDGSDQGAVEGALLGPRGEAATLQVLRAGATAPATIQTVRDQVRTPAVSTVRLDADVVYAHITQFQEGAAAELTAALDKFSKEGGFKAIVLDLRDDPGGLLKEAISVADLFLDTGVIVSTWGRVESERQEHRATPGGYTQPVIVIVNGLSASASEVVAGALQDTGRGKLVGTHTYGKGTVQQIFEHRDGSALKLTVGRYYTPSGKPVATKEGRAPDVVVPWPSDGSPRARLIDDLAALDEATPKRAEMLALVAQLPDVELKALHTDIPWEASVPERLAHDPQLAAALDLAHKAR